MIRHKITMLAVFVSAIALAYFVGLHMGVCEGEKRGAMSVMRDQAYYEKIVNTDKNLFKHVTAKDNLLRSGSYIFHCNYPDESFEKLFYLTFNEGIMHAPPNPDRKTYTIVNARQKDGIVSWKQIDIHEGPSYYYVGRIDGDRIFGKVYASGVYGWRVEPHRTGAWKIVKTSLRAPDDSAGGSTTANESP